MDDKKKKSKRSQYIEYGGETDQYKWDQWEDEVQVTIPGFKGVPTKDINCKLKKKHIFLAKKGEAPIFDGDLPHEIDLEESSWTVLDGVVDIILVKGVTSETWWDCVQVGHPTIDVKAIDGAKYLDDSILKKIWAQKQQQKKEQAEKEAAEKAGQQAAPTEPEKQ